MHKKNRIAPSPPVLPSPFHDHQIIVVVAIKKNINNNPSHLRLNHTTLECLFWV